MSLDSALFLSINGASSSPHWLTALALFSTNHLPQLIAGGAVGAFLVGDRDVKLGEIGGAEFFISPSQFEYWKHTQLIIDVVPGRGGMFSLENGEGVRFLVRSRLFADAEFAALRAAERV